MAPTHSGPFYPQDGDLRVAVLLFGAATDSPTPADCWSTARHPDRRPRARNAGGVILRCPCAPRRITASGYSPCGSSFRRGWNLGAQTPISSRSHGGTAQGACRPQAAKPRLRDLPGI